MAMNKAQLQAAIIHLETEKGVEHRNLDGLTVAVLTGYKKDLEAKEPEVAKEPETTSEPEVAKEPEVASEPETTSEPEVAKEPETTSEPEKKVDNSATILVKTAILGNELAGNVWNRTGRLIAENKAMFADGVKKKDMAANFTKLLDANVDQSIIPESGLSRTGETITLRKAKGNKVKWSSWEKTARMVQNTSTIFKALELCGYSACFPHGVLVPRSALEKLIKEVAEDKPGEAPIDTAKRCLDLATKKIAEIAELDDLVNLNEFIEYANEVFAAQMKTLKESAKEAEEA